MRLRPTLYFEKKHAEIYLNALKNAIKADLNTHSTNWETSKQAFHENDILATHDYILKTLKRNYLVYSRIASPIN